MVACKCDRCGGYFDPDERGCVPAIRKSSYGLNNMNGGFCKNDITYMLCSFCSGSFDAWLHDCIKEDVQK